MSDNTVTPVQEAQQQAPVVAAQPQQETSKEQNLRYLRERAEAAERRAAELENQFKQQQKPQEPDDDFGIDDESYIEGKHLKKYVRSLKNEVESTRKQLHEISTKAVVNTAHLQLKSEYKDFDSVVSQDNLDKLSRVKPALYRSIMANQDIYDRGSSAYEMIKASGFYDKQVDEIDRRLEENKSKPRSVSTIAPQTSDSALANVHEYDRRVLTKEQKEQMVRQMNEYKKARV